MSNVLNPARYVRRPPILPTSRIPTPPPQVIGIDKDQWMQIAAALAQRHIYEKTGKQDVRLTRALRSTEPAYLPGWHWIFKDSSALRGFPCGHAFRGWTLIRVQQFIRDLEQGHLELRRIPDMSTTIQEEQHPEQAVEAKSKTKRKCKLKTHDLPLALPNPATREVEDTIEAHEDVEVQFTDSGYAILKTESSGLHCGIFALCKSIKEQVPAIPNPTFNDLIKIARTGIVSRRIQETLLFGENFERNFTVDHLAAVLQQYGKKYDQNLHLGICWEGREPYVIPGENQYKPRTVWLHNSNINEARGYSHYSGMLSGPDMAPAESADHDHAEEAVVVEAEPIDTIVQNKEDKTLKDSVNVKKRKSKVYTKEKPRKRPRKISSPISPGTTEEEAPSSPILSAFTAFQALNLLPSIEEDEGNSAYNLSCITPSNSSSPSRQNGAMAPPPSKCTKKLKKTRLGMPLRTPFSQASFRPSPPTYVTKRDDPYPSRAHQTPGNLGVGTSAWSGVNTLEPRDSEEYEVAKVVGELWDIAGHRFHLQWAGSEDTSWVDARDCLCQDLIEEFRQGLPTGSIYPNITTDEARAFSPSSLKRQVATRSSLSVDLPSGGNRSGRPFFHQPLVNSTKALQHLSHNLAASKREQKFLNDVSSDILHGSETSVNPISSPSHERSGDESELSCSPTLGPVRTFALAFQKERTLGVSVGSGARNQKAARNQLHKSPKSDADSSSDSNLGGNTVSRQLNLEKIIKQSLPQMGKKMLYIDLTSPEPEQMDGTQDSKNKDSDSHNEGVLSVVMSCSCDSELGCAKMRVQALNNMMKQEHYTGSKKAKKNMRKEFLTTWDKRHEQKMKASTSYSNTHRKWSTVGEDSSVRPQPSAVPSVIRKPPIGQTSNVTSASETRSGSTKNTKPDAPSESNATRIGSKSPITDRPALGTLPKRDGDGLLKDCRPEIYPGLPLTKKMEMYPPDQCPQPQSDFLVTPLAVHVGPRRQQPSVTIHPFSSRKEEPAVPVIKMNHMDLSKSPSKSSSHYFVHPGKGKLDIFKIAKNRPTANTQQRLKKADARLVMNGTRQNNDPGKQVQSYLFDNYRGRSATHESVLERKLNGEYVQAREQPSRRRKR